MIAVLKEGDKAPDFTVKDQDGNVVKLGSLKGKKVALYFYPKDMTPGCTIQACNIRDNYDSLKKAGIVIFGVSPDDEKSHINFIDEKDLPFTLLADTDKTMVKKYGVWVEKNMYGKKYKGVQRTTFLIDEKGNIKKVIVKPVVANHSSEILDGFKS